MKACTIIAKNYVAQARVLARSFTEHHPGERLTVLVIDDCDGYLKADEEPFRLLTPAEIGCDCFDAMALRYEVIELSTAVKPWLLRTLLAEGAPAVTYLDPDIRIYGSLERLDELARAHGVVLTPHNNRPIPDDGCRPTQVDILIAGVYNLGYISLGPGAEIDDLLDWWSDRLRRDCRVDPVYGYFVDQRWFDLAPGLVSDFAVVRDPEYNVAYWNAHARTLAGDAQSGYTVDGRPLRFFHFSGFDPNEPHLLSRHQSRLKLSDHPALARLCHDYAREALGQGFDQARKWPYTYGRLADGSPLNRLLRELYDIAHESGAVTASPFTSSGTDEFLAWLSETPDGAPPQFNRALAHIYGTRPDVRSVFPELSGDGLRSFFAWVATSSDPIVDLPSVLKQAPVRAAGTPSPAPPSPRPAPEPGPGSGPAAARTPWGVNVVGYFRSELGVGEAARQVVSALDTTGVPVLPVHGRTIPPNRQAHPFTHLDHTDARFPVNLICMNADALPEFAGQAGPGFFAQRYSIGLWFWEVTRVPDRWRESFDLLDEVWAPTQHIADALGAVSPIPVVKVTIPITMPIGVTRTRAELGLPEGFLFLFSFDYHSVFERKNPLGLVRAFADAFAPGEGAVLVIKCINEGSDPANHERLLLAAAEHPDIHVKAGYVSPQDKDAITAACDCYVSLHRSEGFGLTMAEAMYVGKPVIATGYSGNLDFMTPTDSHLVDYRLTAIGPTAPPYPADGEWAEPDVGHASRLMRNVFEDRPAAEELGRRAAADVRRTHSPAAAGEIMRRHLERVRPTAQERATSRAHTSPALGPLAERVSRGPAPGARVAGGTLGRVGRRLLLRAMRPFTAYQADVNARLIDTARELAGSQAALAAEAARNEALLLTEIRHLGAAIERDATTGLENVLTLQRAVAGRLDDLQTEVGAPGRVARLDRDLRALQAELRAIPYMEGVPFVAARHPQAGRVEGYRAAGGGGKAARGYLGFEDVFRGSEDLIRERQARYLDLIGHHAPVLDLGCGRGEFLDLLRERGVEYAGVDSDEEMVRRCHEKGHGIVVHGDGIEYLAGLEDGSLGVLFSAQVIEHLPHEALTRMLALARAKLAVDGLLILETVNPHSVQALKAFWVDLTHQHPIFPEVALVLCQVARFAEAFVFFPNGEGDVERDRFGQGEYAVVAGGEGLLSPGPSARKANSRVRGAARGELATS